MNGPDEFIINGLRKYKNLPRGKEIMFYYWHVNKMEIWKLITRRCQKWTEQWMTREMGSNDSKINLKDSATVDKFIDKIDDGREEKEILCWTRSQRYCTEQKNLI